MTLATCSKDLKLYNWPGITLAGVYETPDDCVVIKTISWSSDGKSLVIVKSKDNPLMISVPFQVDKRLEPTSILKNISARSGVFANTSNTSVAFGNIDGAVCIYDLRKKRIINEYQAVPSSVNFLDFSFEDTCLAAGCANGQIVLYTSNTQPCASYSVPYSHSLSAMTFNKTQSDLLAAGSKEGAICVWDTTKGAALVTGKDHTGTITDLAFYGETVASVGVDGKFINYDLRSNEYTSCYNLNVPISSLALLHNSYEMAIGTSDGQLRSYDRRQITSPINTVVAYNAAVRKICFQPSSNSPISSRPTTKGSEFNQRHNIDAANKPPPASAGDFNPDFSPSSSTIMSIAGDAKDLENIYLHEMLPPSASQIDVQKNSISSEELNRFAGEMDEYLKQHKRKIEDKMLAEFYQMRIEISKQFIELQDKITKSWDGFMQYLRMSNDDEHHSEKSSSVQTFKHAVSDIKSGKTKKTKMKM
ncbi:protein NEDD1-like isoform X2 [Harmonia axyridis]|uniref:protein NEDD1-like isoform X2 n=1 Tax=Harmonia axyridis TaxID=115357 RepID=UPI001E27753A|nr:protein NEDD1-like isoform X2 [Harmonia axyridis]